ncbi:MAG TPA: hypothetical protein VNU26_15500 [Mycobacteriales bacterium]|nr:hypothetical protein [Mycobacteriales bacterium]
MSEQTPASSAPDGPDGPDERPPAERGSDGPGSDGPVDLGDRTAPGASGTGYSGSPTGNQGKTEPMPSTPGHRDPNAPLTPPTLDEMTVGADDPQRPSFGGSAPTAGAVSAPDHLSGPGAAPYASRPQADGTSPTGTDRGPEVPLSSTPGESHRAPGLQGAASPAERVDTDVERSAGAMARDTGRPAGPGDPRGVPSVGTTPSGGTSEEHGVVQGARIPPEQDRS